jgi:threonine aldolase
VGSALVGAKASVNAARRYRKMLGGGMRQAGILAAGALFALEHQRQRLSLDHDSAKVFAHTLSLLPGVQVVPPETNIVSIALEGLSAERAVVEARARGVLVNATGPRSLRAVTHLDLSAADVERAAERLCDAIVQLRGAWT